MCSAWIETVETPRLRLRPVRPDDAPRIAVLLAEPAVTRMTARIPQPYTRADADAFVARQADPLTAERVFAVELPGEGLVGTLGFRPRKGSPLPEFGYWYGRPYWGAGFATEAAGAALGWAHGRWGRRAVVAGHFADNPASGRVLEKAGFLYTGERELLTSLGREAPAESRRMVWLA